MEEEMMSIQRLGFTAIAFLVLVLSSSADAECGCGCPRNEITFVRNGDTIVANCTLMGEDADGTLFGALQSQVDVCEIRGASPNVTLNNIGTGVPFVGPIATSVAVRIDAGLLNGTSGQVCMSGTAGYADCTLGILYDSTPVECQPFTVN
jgi:hypothetical protein